MKEIYRGYAIELVVRICPAREGERRLGPGVVGTARHARFTVAGAVRRRLLRRQQRQLRHRAWWKAGDIYLLVENRYDHAAGRLDIEYTFLTNGRAEVRRGTHRAYAYRELVDLMSASGFAVEVGEPWTREADSVSFIATAI